MFGCKKDGDRVERESSFVEEYIDLVEKLVRDRVEEKGRRMQSTQVILRERGGVNDGLLLKIAQSGV